MTLTINKEYSNSTKAPRNDKTYPKLTKILKQHDRPGCGISVVKFGQDIYRK